VKLPSFSAVSGYNPGIDIQTSLLTGILVTSAICAVAGVWASSKNKNIDEYFLMGGNLKPIGFIGTMLSTNLSLGNFILISAIWGYLFGWSGMLWWTVNLIVNAFAYYWALPKFKSFIEDKSNSGSVHEYLAVNFVSKADATVGSANARRRLRLWASVATSICLLLATTFELHLAAQILSDLTNTSIVLLYTLLVFTIVLYTAWGGFRSVVATDLVQGALVLFCAVAGVVLIARYSNDGLFPPSLPSLTRANLFDVGWANIVSIIVVATGWFWVTMDTWQRSAASRSAKTSAVGFGWYTVLIIVYGCIFSYIGIFDANYLKGSLTGEELARHRGEGNPIYDLFLVNAATKDAIGTSLLAMIAVGLWMAAMSTADTFLTVATSSLVQDAVLVRKTPDQDAEQERNRQLTLVGLSKALMIGLGVGLLVIWVILHFSGVLVDVSSFFFVVYGVQFALMVPVIFTFINSARRPSCEAVTKAVMIGVAVALLVGFGSWGYMKATGDSTFLGIKGSEWMTLTPVVTVLSGLVMLLPAMRRSTT
jgi:Na+/proline symporter